MAGTAPSESQLTIPAAEFRGDECSSLSCSSKSRSPTAEAGATPTSGAVERVVPSCPIVHLQGFKTLRAGGDLDITLQMGTVSLTRPHSILVAEEPILLSPWVS